jgi:hypothetical protein
MKKIMIKNWQEVVIVLLVLVMPISTILMSRLQVSSGAVVSAEQPVVVATQEDFERLADEYSRYFEIREDGSIELNLDKDIRGEVEVIKEKAYREYMDRGIVLYDGSGLDYADYEVWQETEVKIEELPEVSEQDKVLLEQYREFLNNLNSMLREGIFVAVVEDGLIKYEMVEQNRYNAPDGGIKQRGVSDLFSGRNSFDVTYNRISIPYPVGMKWFCQIIWGYYDVYVPSGYEIHFSISSAVLLSSLIYLVASMNIYSATISGVVSALQLYLKSDIVQLLNEILGIDIYELANIILLFAIGSISVAVLVGAFTFGLGGVVMTIIDMLLGLLASYMTRISNSLIDNAQKMVVDIIRGTSNKNTVRMNSDLIFWNNSFSTMRY